MIDNNTNYMKKTNKKAGNEIAWQITNINYKPTKLQQATWISTLLVNSLMIIFVGLFVWAVWSVGNSNINNYSTQHCYNGSNSADINCLLSI